MKVYFAQGNTHYGNWFPFDVKVVDSVEEAELVVFEGGEDVSPELYDEPAHPYTYSNMDRDLREMEVFKTALDLNIPMVGVCRGAQFGCIMSGGKLVQDQPNPGAHMMKYMHNDEEIKEILVTSTHHQAQFPFNLPEDDYKIIGWTNNLSSHHEDGHEKEMIPPKECEVVYYNKTNFLGIQPHPEMMLYRDTIIHPQYQESIIWFRELLTNFLNKTL